MNKNMTEGKIYSTLIRFVIPVFFSLFLQALYGAVDLLVVGHYGQTIDVSGVAVGSQLMQTCTMLITNLSMGVTVIVGEKIGEKRPKEAGIAIGTGITLFAIISVIMTLMIELLAPGMAAVLRTPAESFEKTVSYLRICGAGSIFIVAYNIIGSIFRGIGDAKTPLITVAIATVVNIIGDLFFVRGCGLGASGAALATVAAQAVSVVISYFVIKKRGIPFEFDKSYLRVRKEIAAAELKLGAPLALMEVLVGGSFLFLQAITNSFGVIYSAAIGVTQKLVAFIMLLPAGFAQAMTTFTAQNMGAGKPDRAKKALKYSISTAVGLGLFVAYFSFFHGNLLAEIFTEDSAVVPHAWAYMRSYSIDCLLTPFLFCLHGYFNGRERTGFVTVECLVGAFIIRIPIAFLMSRIFGAQMFYIGMATPCATLVQIIMCIIMYIKIEKEDKRKEVYIKQ